MRLMHAVRIHAFGNPDVLELDDVSVPEPTAHEIVIRVAAASVNPVDYKIRAGKYPAVRKDQLPKVLGRDVSGVVETVGAEATKFQKGDAVYAMLGRDVGGYAEYALATDTEAAPKPKTLDFVQAAAVPLAALTAWQGLFEHGRLRAGQRVLIHGGGGGVGHFAVQFAKAKGAWVATTVSADDIGMVKSLGADQAIDYKNEKFEDAVQNIDLVFDLIAGETQQRSWAVLKNGGSLISTLQKPDEKTARARNIRATNYVAAPNAQQLEEIARLIDEGKVKPVVNAIYALEDVARAHRHMENDHIQGKVVLKVAA
ncbi:MAG TPA: NADP-dependent oxidoreductase [Pseudolabrys sp.]|nr:NADP-dependent oxidoreductase [Pseudolabrys sp.]